MGKPDYEELLSGIPDQQVSKKTTDGTPLSEQAEQPDQIGNANQLDHSTQPTQSGQVSKSTQPDNADQSSQPRRSNQSSQSDNADQPEQSNHTDRSNHADQPDQPGELITFSVRMPTEYIDAIKAIAWWERCTQRAFLEQSVDRYRKSQGLAHMDKILREFHANN